MEQRSPHWARQAAEAVFWRVLAWENGERVDGFLGHCLLPAVEL
ncbi:MAG: hypothetical protein ANABAC_2874 [Anaerolineae bacterium]|nr:MAG: hypothetical protein ANABAC_2874 [Anaerolineae bacterium]